MMTTTFAETKVSIILLSPKELPYEPAMLAASLRSALDQDHTNCEVILADGRGDAAVLPEGVEGVKLIAGSFPSRASMLEAGR